ncbi:hypothetical protein [Mycobacterium innocens]|uniref:PPW family C-terminal domain-containing PPE protein n=1 Tax=Mycobacterium innocens TaxID=2341083 RepID=UPI000A5C9381|nr:MULTISPECIES: hypothetical protein [Mycobacterium]
MLPAAAVAVSGVAPAGLGASASVVPPAQLASPAASGGGAVGFAGTAPAESVGSAGGLVAIGVGEGPTVPILPTAWNPDLADVL